MTLLLIVAITAAFQTLGHCCFARNGNSQSGFSAGAGRGPIPLAEVASSGSMQNQPWGDVVSPNMPGEATMTPVGTKVGSAAAATVVSASEQQQHPHGGQQVDDSNFAIADGDDYEEF